MLRFQAIRFSGKFVKIQQEMSKMNKDLPNNKAGYDCSHECISQYGANVSEKMPLYKMKVRVY